MKTTTTTLVDEVLPEFDFRSRHARRVDASPERVAEAIDRFRLGGTASAQRTSGLTDVITETRVRCVDDAARRRFAIYWFLIRVFSGWLRRDLLRRIARIAEGAE
jgi:hypothetical protein